MIRDPSEAHICETEIAALDARLASSPLGWTFKPDIAFGTHPLQSLDALFPTSPTAPLPAVLLVHGGGWMGGDKAAPHYRLLLRQFADAGFAAFSSDYRLAPLHRFPSPAEDVAAAAAFIIQNASDFQIRPDRLAAMGSSAGGHLAALVALAGSRFGAPTTGDFPGPFAAAACIATPTDFRPDDTFSQNHADPAALALFGRPLSEIPEIAAEASPVAHAGPSAPPFLLLHNRDDPRVDSLFSSRLHSALLQSGAHSEIELFAGDSHGLRLIHREVFQKVASFFSRFLAP